MIGYVNFKFVLVIYSICMINIWCIDIFFDFIIGFGCLKVTEKEEEESEERRGLSKGTNRLQFLIIINGFSLLAWVLWSLPSPAAWQRRVGFVWGLSIWVVPHYRWIVFLLLLFWLLSFVLFLLRSSALICKGFLRWRLCSGRVLWSTCKRGLLIQLHFFSVCIDQNHFVYCSKDFLYLLVIFFNILYFIIFYLFYFKIIIYFYHFTYDLYIN